MSYIESVTNGMYPVLHNHMFGVNGKISGSISAAGEMTNVIPIIHGPLGCAFYYRYSSRRRHEPFYNVYSSDLREEDIIFGGREKLIKTIDYVHGKHDPDLIVVISSTVSDVLNEDIEGAIAHFQGEFPLVQVRSELFSHRDKNFTSKRLKELSNQKIGQEKNIALDLKGCGYSEFLVGLVNDFMEPGPVEPNTVNIEAIAWGSKGSETLGDIENFLARSGVGVVSRLPSDRSENIRRAPRASLNIARRLRWAREMEKNFGTPYIHINNMNRYSGFSGAENFYRDIHEALAGDDRILEQLEIEMARVREETRADLEKLASYRVGLYGANLGGLPAQIKKYREEYRLDIRYIVLEFKELNVQALNIDRATLTRLYERVEEARLEYCREAVFLVNPGPDELRAMRGELDALVGSTNPSLETWGLPLVASNTDEAHYTFESYQLSVSRLLRRLETARNKPDLLLNLLDFDRAYYPLVQKKDNMASRQMWIDMWLNKEG